MSVVNNELLAMNNPIKVRTIHMIRVQCQFLTLCFCILRLSIISITHLIAKMIHNKTINTKIIVSHDDLKQVNNNQSKAERIDATNTNVLSSNSGFFKVKAIPVIQKIKAQTAKVITTVAKPKLGIVNKQHQKTR